MDTVLSILSFLWPFAVVILTVYYLILSVYVHNPSLYEQEMQYGGVDKLTRKQKRDFFKSRLQTMKMALLTQSIFAVLLALGMYLKHQDLLAVGLALLSAWDLFDYRTMKTAETKRKEHGVHNNGLIRCLSVIPVRDVDMNKVDKEIDKQLSEIEKMRR